MERKKAESAPRPIPVSLASSVLVLGKSTPAKIVSQTNVQKINPDKESSFPRKRKKTREMAKVEKRKIIKLRKVIFMKVF